MECFLELESKAQMGSFTSWSLANNEGCMSSFWADECLINKINKAEDQDYLFHPFFDLSSLTKPLFLNLYLRNLFGNDFIKVISTPINDLIISRNRCEENYDLIAFIMEHKNKLSLNSFLSHFSGAKSWFWMGSALWSQKTTPHHLDPNIFYNHIDLKSVEYNKIIKFNLNGFSIKSLQTDEYGKYLYSDINYYILARLVESFFLKDSSWDDVVNQLNEKLQTRFFHAGLDPDKANLCIPYFPYISFYNSELKHDNLKENIFGSVNDTNANILSSLGKGKNIISGHSGFFGSIIDVIQGLKELLISQDNYLNKIGYISDKNVRFVYGLDTPSSKNSTAGLNDWSKYKDKVFGHLGYTGTAFWFSSERKNARNNFHTLLTNRTAQRSKYGVEKCPRIYIYTDLLNGESKYFQAIENFFIELPKMELIDTLNEFHGISKRIWNQSVVRMQPNINETRRYIANKLWNI